MNFLCAIFFYQRNSTSSETKRHRNDNCTSVHFKRSSSTDFLRFGLFSFLSVFSLYLPLHGQMFWTLTAYSQYHEFQMHFAMLTHTHINAIHIYLHTVMDRLARTNINSAGTFSTHSSNPMENEQVVSVLPCIFPSATMKHHNNIRIRWHSNSTDCIVIHAINFVYAVHIHCVDRFVLKIHLYVSCFNVLYNWTSMHYLCLISSLSMCVILLHLMYKSLQRKTRKRKRKKNKYNTNKMMIICEKNTI